MSGRALGLLLLAGTIAAGGYLMMKDLSRTVPQLQDTGQDRGIVLRGATYRHEMSEGYLLLHVGEARKHDRGIDARSVDADLHGAQGEQVSLRASRGAFAESLDVLSLQMVHGGVSTDRGHLQLSAAEGRIHTASREVVLSGGVRVRAESGDILVLSADRGSFRKGVFLFTGNVQAVLGGTRF
ncbi:MAG: hypothetical protein K9L28_01250 [Synergistales bacterium]|nr:hypothetical protein [Synergistales bacterium]